MSPRENTLVLGSRRYSSWSLRGWLAVRLAGLDVAEHIIPLDGTGHSPGLAEASPSLLVPVLHHAGASIWESLAICEYCAEIAPGLWPADRVARAHARAISAEMHAGFRALRVALPMSLERQVATPFQPDNAVAADIARIAAIWRDTQARFAAGGAFLFGATPGAADAMFAPVAARLLTYRPPIEADTRAYCAAWRAHPLLAAWYDAALAEPAAWRIAKYEAPM